MDEQALRNVETTATQSNQLLSVAPGELRPLPIVARPAPAFVDSTAPHAAEPAAPPVCSAALPEPEPPPLAAAPSLPLTPPVPVAKAIDSRRTARRWLAERWRETPAWLASLVLHLALLVTFGTIMIPYGRVQVVDLLLIMMSGQDDTEIASQSVIVAPDLELEEPGEAGQAGDTLVPHQPQLADVTELRVDAPLVDSRANHPLDVIPENDLLVSTTPAPAGSNLAVLPVGSDPGIFARSSEIITSIEARVEQREQDDAVNRFIEFDIGKLRGAEGERARRDFDRLGPDSLPALIRGLNKSAYISATCPVMVLQSKIQSELAKSNDAASLRYAIDHIGQGVSPRAAHAKLIASLRESLRRRVQGEERFLQETLTARALPDMENQLPRIRALRTQPYASITKALASGDDKERLAAIVATSIRDDGCFISDAQRVELARRLIAVLDEPDEVLRREAHRALVKLSFEDVQKQPDDQLVQADPSAAAQQWTKNWDHFSKTRNVDARASSALKIADVFRERRQEEKAIERYRQVITDYPGTPAAELAQERLAIQPPRKRSTKGLDLTKQ